MKGKEKWDGVSPASAPMDYIPPYGDLSKMDRDGLILKAVGAESLRNIASDFMELLGTSCAVYEKNGDYALGIFASGWCQRLDTAAYKLCGTKDTLKALKSKKWLCHESCWNDCARQCIEKKRPSDIECNGGIRICGVPILADGEVVGAINFGYGTPPADRETLAELAKKYRVDLKELEKARKEYQPRPDVLVEMAKRRLRNSALLIGKVVESYIARKKLRESEERFRQLFDHMRSGVAVFEPCEDGKDFIFVDYNRAAEKLDKTKKSEIIGRKVTEVFPGVREMGLFDIFVKVYRTGRPEHHPLRKYKDERLVGWRDNYVYKLPCGNIVSIYQDLTEIMKSRKALQESEERYSTLFAASPLPIKIFDESDHIIEANPASCELHGCSRKQLLNLKPPDFIAPENRHVFHEFKETIARGEDYHGFGKISRADGTEALIEIFGAPIMLGGKKCYLSIEPISKLLASSL